MESKDYVTRNNGMKTGVRQMLLRDSVPQMIHMETMKAKNNIEKIFHSNNNIRKEHQELIREFDALMKEMGPEFTGGSRTVTEVGEPMVVRDRNKVKILSPTFGHYVSFNMTKPARFGTSDGARNELLHIESQIKKLECLPDFGYQSDNYLLDDTSN